MPQIQIWLVFTLILALSAFVRCDENYVEEEVFEHEHLFGKVVKIPQEPKFREIYLVGDSLLAVPEMFFSLSTSLRDALAKNHPDFEIGVEIHVQSGMTVHYMSKQIRESLESRKNAKKPFPDVAILLTDSDGWPRTEAWRLGLQHLLKVLVRHIGFVLLVGPGLYTYEGEMMSSWNDTKQVHLDAAIEVEKMEARKESASFINLREIFKANIVEYSKHGIFGINLKHMIGKSKSWKILSAEGKYIIWC